MLTMSDVTRTDTDIRSLPSSPSPPPEKKSTIEQHGVDLNTTFVHVVRSQQIISSNTVLT